MVKKSVPGFSYLWQGLKLIQQPGIRFYAFVPILINLMLFIILGVAASHYFNTLVQWANGFLPSWLAWLDWLFWIIFVITLIIVISSVFVFFSNLIAAPFNSLLAEEVAYKVAGLPPVPFTWIGFIKMVPRTLKRQLQYLGYFLPRALLLLVLFLIPGVQIIAPLCWFIFSSWIMAIQYFDYPMDNNNVNFLFMRKQLATKRILSLEFGAGIVLSLMIPIVNLLIMPAAVAGATLCWVERYQQAKI